MGFPTRRAWLAGLGLALALAPRTAAAQAAPLTVPGGALRVSLGAAMDSWNDALPGSGEPVAIEAAQATRLAGALGLALGLTDRITLTASVPFERHRVQAEAADPAVDIPGDRAAGLGDVAGGIALRLAGSTVDAPMDGPRVEVAGTARLPTGRVLRSAQYYTLASGNGQGQLEIAGRVHLPAGGIGLRLDGAYVLPFGDADDGLDRDGYAVVEASPRIRLSRSVALEAGVRQVVRPDAAGGAATAVGGGVALFAPARPGAEGRGLPLAASWRLMKVVSAAAGQPEPFSVTAEVQLYYGLFR